MTPIVNTQMSGSGTTIFAIQSRNSSRADFPVDNILLKYGQDVRHFACSFISRDDDECSWYGAAGGQ